MASWYYVISKTREKSGPHDEAFVRAKFIAGEIAPASLVWHDGLANWIPASEAFAALTIPGRRGRQGAPARRAARLDDLCGHHDRPVGSIFPALLLYGFPMLLAGLAVLGARSALDRTPFVSPDMVPFFLKLRTFFCCWGWMYHHRLCSSPSCSCWSIPASSLWSVSSGQAPFIPPLPPDAPWPFHPKNATATPATSTCRGFGGHAQEKLRAGRVLVVGCGGLGSPALYYLAAAGVGLLGLMDPDLVEISNLQRQILHATPDIGRPKIDSAVGRLRALNPHVRLAPHTERLTADNAREIFSPYDIILDATDNFASKYLINDICVAMKKPFVHAGISGFCGQLLAVLPGKSACLRCVFPVAAAPLRPGVGPRRRTARCGPRRHRLPAGRRSHQVPFRHRRAADRHPAHLRRTRSRIPPCPCHPKPRLPRLRRRRENQGVIPMAETIQFTLNGAPQTVALEGWEKIIDVLREHLNLTGTKRGCDDGTCGACTIVLDGEARKACLFPAKKLDGANVLTIEGISQGMEIHPIQKALVEAGAVQCGYCIPGIVLELYALFTKNVAPPTTRSRPPSPATSAAAPATKPSGTAPSSPRNTAGPGLNRKPTTPYANDTKKSHGVGLQPLNP